MPYRRREESLAERRERWWHHVREHNGLPNPWREDRDAPPLGIHVEAVPDGMGTNMRAWFGEGAWSIFLDLPLS